jgi:hypothetical protein
MCARTRNNRARRDTFAFNIPATWSDVRKEIVQSNPLFLHYPSIESVLQWLLLFLGMTNAEKMACVRWGWY